MIGASITRLEDPRLITGKGRFVDDLRPEGTLHAVFLRSQEAHARITSIDVDTAYDGPATLYTAKDLGIEASMPIQNPSPLITLEITQPPLAIGEVVYVGQPIAVIVAPTVQEAMDAQDHIWVDYEPLESVVDPKAAVETDAPPVHEGAVTNKLAAITNVTGDAEVGLANSTHTLTIEHDQHRGAVASIEGRAILAKWDEEDQQLSLWSSTQAPHAVRGLLSRYFDMSPDAIRVVAPDVGGGFGPKAGVYPEAYVMAALALHLRCPVKWTELRREHFMATMQARGLSGVTEVGFDERGVVQALRARMVHDSGAYVSYGIVVALTTMRLMSGPYPIPAFDVRIDCVYTNAPPAGAIRGAGRPNAVFIVERVMDAIAAHLSIDRAEVRRRNFIRPEQLPFESGILAPNGQPYTYDSGDYRALLDEALERADIAGFDARRATSAANGMLRGYGLATYVEDTGLGPYDGARLEVLPNGDVVVEVGVATQGQGHETVWAQLVSDQIGVDPSQVRVHRGDTARYGQALGTVASRTGQNTGSTVHVAAIDLATKIKNLAADHLEASPDDIVLQDGVAMVIGQPGSEIPLGTLAANAEARIGARIPRDTTSPGLSVERVLPFEGLAFAYGTHVAEVEIDPDTGHINVDRYLVAHDCGTILNPMIVDGQIDGGVAHGLGNALMEKVAYGEGGQPITTSFMDYRLMTAVDMPHLDKTHRQTPSPTNPLGAKGAGEGGTIPAAAVIASAVEHALADYGVSVNHYPISAEWVYQTITGGA